MRNNSLENFKAIKAAYDACFEVKDQNDYRPQSFKDFEELIKKEEVKFKNEIKKDMIEIARRKGCCEKLAEFWANVIIQFFESEEHKKQMKNISLEMVLYGKILTDEERQSLKEAFK